MKHSFRLKKSSLKSIFSNKLDFKSLSIENSNDVENSVNTLLMFIELEMFLDAVNCSYNFLTSHVSFELELNESKGKTDFFTSIKKFDNFIRS